MKIENLKEFIKSTKKSKSTIVRFYKKNEDLFLKTEIKNGKRYYPKEHVRYFDSEILHDENKVLRLENQSMKNLIDGLMDKDTFQKDMWYMDWSFFGTIAYQLERNKKSCFRLMNEINDELIQKYGTETEIRIFFVTEPFANRKGYHNHFTLYISNNKLKEEIVNDIKSFFSYDRVDLTIYDKYKAGLFYMAKGGFVNEDWDLLGNNLSKQTNYAN